MSIVKLASTRISKKLRMQKEISDQQMIHEALKTIDNPYLKRKIRVALIVRQLL